MSADNGIYILVTKDSHKKQGTSWINTFGKGIIAYRVAHAQAIDNLTWYEKNQPYNVGYYLDQIWGKSNIYYDLEAAKNEAHWQADTHVILEYGVSVIERFQYSFPN